MTEASETDYLYHYTTQDGLIGILDNNCIWATHYKFLNDYSEIDFFKNELVKLIEPDVRKSLEKAYSVFLEKTDPYSNDEKSAIAKSTAEIHCFEKTNEIINDIPLLE